jgi:hypothetical protein
LPAGCRRSPTATHGARKAGRDDRGFLQAHDDDPTLFHFLLFVQHGQLGKLAPTRRRR